MHKPAQNRTIPNIASYSAIISLEKQNNTPFQRVVSLERKHVQTRKTRSGACEQNDPVICTMYEPVILLNSIPSCLQRRAKSNFSLDYATQSVTPSPSYLWSSITLQSVRSWTIFQRGPGHSVERRTLEPIYYSQQPIISCSAGAGGW